MYTDVHRSFIQTIAIHGAMEKQSALQTLSLILDKYDTEKASNEETLKEIIDTINEKIYFLDQKILVEPYDLLNQEFVIYSNTVDDPINKCQNAFTMRERQYFRLLLKEIATVEKHCFRLIVGINLTSDMQDNKITRSQADDLIQQWLHLGYFSKVTQNNDEMIYLGPKGIAEFAVHLKNRYPNDIGVCQICQAVIFYGVSCGNNCLAIYHRKCVKERLKRFTDCLSCKSLWSKRIST